MSPDHAPTDTLVFDTGPLSAFARINQLEVLRVSVGERRAVIPHAVCEELKRGSYRYSWIRPVLDADWIEQRCSQTAAEINAFAMFAQRLVSGDRNVGEAAVLALAKTMPAVAVIDDSAAYKAAKRASVDCTRTLGLLCNAIHDRRLTVDSVSAIADSLITTEYRLPFGPGDFARWANDNNLGLPMSERGV